ncbi:Vang-like protein 2 [Eumeta japonica]|uniref:Vang-like protein 2 n=1 Tax=Eumeta variegata TaxID=151549 RepID=A0A4C1WPN1_EUMVA|nr:Vang-like protein 2 [Eumeta japonica]
METESVRSEVSGRSRRSSRHRSHTHRSTRSTKSQRKEYGEGVMAPFQTSVNINPESGRDGQEVIEVQILPQDENWGENTTAITGNTSEGSQSMEDLSNWPMEPDSGITFMCSRYFGATVALGLSFVSFVSPLAMVVLPKIGFFPGLTDNIALQPSQRIQLLSCTAECKEPAYYIKIVRSPDGESRSYAIGQFSIQRAAVWVLQKYYTEFPIYNPYLEKIPISKSQRKAQSSIKFYEVDGSNPNMQSGQARSTTGSTGGGGSTCGRRRDSSSAHNERYYEEAERERRVRKRRARLLTAAEDAFAHVRRVRLSTANGGALGPREAAQAVFPSLARALQKYLRATRQQPRHSADSVLAHLARCLSQDSSPRAFLEPFLVEGPVLATEQENRPLQRWSLVSDELLARPLADGIEFQLRQGDLSLVCSIKQLPKFSLTEEVVDPKSNRFVLRLNSETSV